MNAKLLLPIAACVPLLALSQDPSPAQGPARFLDALPVGTKIFVEETKHGLWKVTIVDFESPMKVTHLGEDWFAYSDPIGTEHRIPQTAIAEIYKMPKVRK